MPAAAPALDVRALPVPRPERPVARPERPGGPLPRALAWTSSGLLLGFAPLQRGDAAAVLAVFEGMSSESRRMRFLSGISTLAPRMLAVLTDVDHERHTAWSASDGERLVAVGRSIRCADDPSTAEIALSVIDSHHRRGVGRTLLGVLAAAAPQDVTTFLLVADPENTAVRGLAAGPLTQTRYVRGTVELRVPRAVVPQVAPARVRPLRAQAAERAAACARSAAR